MGRWEVEDGRSLLNACLSGTDEIRCLVTKSSNLGSDLDPTQPCALTLSTSIVTLTMKFSPSQPCSGVRKINSWTSTTVGTPWVCLDRSCMDVLPDRVSRLGPNMETLSSKKERIADDFPVNQHQNLLFLSRYYWMVSLDCASVICHSAAGVSISWLSLDPTSIRQGHQSSTTLFCTILSHWLQDLLTGRPNFRVQANLVGPRV
ncbi:hypothetical protein ASPFODRAFT_700678 [Aspergillus luchuensis CBS 106.47]|uniref:Uncharacterized protein n=1 Tax=Aspergillus luchuensis (strain CBS 106.47) TaxID=1137211 RepID=A0A1M3T7Z7_ASPLC|nr:hypothetical protein ASPFODRAFT_700678 [Aspergillus luchuensis CBS 106.47]